MAQIEKDWVLKSNYQGKSYWVQIWEWGNETRVVIGTFDGMILKNEYMDTQNLKMGISISPNK